MRNFLIGLTVVAVSGGVNAQSNASLTGSWQLVSWETRDDTGRVTYPMGGDVAGQVIFDEAGYVSIQLMQRKLANFASDDRLNGTPEEVRGAFAGFLAYYGRYSIENGVLTIHVIGASFPNMVGTDQRREIMMEGDRFIGKTPPVLAGGRMVTSVFIWQRAR